VPLTVLVLVLLDGVGPLLWFGYLCFVGHGSCTDLQADGSLFRGAESALTVNKGWRQRGVPCRQICWNYNEEETWEVEFSDPKTGKYVVSTGNNAPQLGEVKFIASTLLGNARRTLRIPFASQTTLTMGDVAGERLDLGEADPAEAEGALHSKGREGVGKDGGDRADEPRNRGEDGRQGGDGDGLQAEGSLEDGLQAEGSLESLGATYSSVSVGSEDMSAREESIKGESSTESVGLSSNAGEHQHRREATGVVEAMQESMHETEVCVPVGMLACVTVGGRVCMREVMTCLACCSLRILKFTLAMQEGGYRYRDDESTGLEAGQRTKTVEGDAAIRDTTAGAEEAEARATTAAGVADVALATEAEAQGNAESPDAAEGGGTRGGTRETSFAEDGQQDALGPAKLPLKIEVRLRAGKP
jgi:hypothetical protein